MHEGRSVSQPEAEVMGDARHRRDPRAHLETRPGNAIADGILDRILPGRGNAGAVTEEDHVEAAALGDAGDFLEHADIGMLPVEPGAGETPLGLDMGPGKVEGKVNSLFHALAPTGAA